MARKRKSRAKPVVRKRAAKLETAFRCPFCSHQDTVECRIDRKHGIAGVVCVACEESYWTKATALTEPVDVYCEWIDECERANADFGD